MIKNRSVVCPAEGILLAVKLYEAVTVSFTISFPSEKLVVIQFKLLVDNVTYVKVLVLPAAVA